jgi:Fur family ferric uptake transcriptional regulator
MPDNSEVINLLKDIIKERGLKYSKQREVIFTTILNSKEHLNADGLCYLFQIFCHRYLIQ